MKKRVWEVSVLCAGFLAIGGIFTAAHGNMLAVYDLSGEVHRYEVIQSEKAASYLSKGWTDAIGEYDTDNYIAMYSDDGRIHYSLKSRAAANNTVGWYYSPRRIMYSADGRTNAVNVEDIPANEAVGWYIEPVALAGNVSGEKRYVLQSEIDDYRQNDWHIIEYSQGLDTLKNDVKNYINGLSGSWGVYIKNLKTDEYMVLNDAGYSSASVIKLFVMAGAYNEIAYGTFPEDAAIKELLTNMITVSDNYSSNQLVKKIGSGSYERGFNDENSHTLSLGCYNTQHKSLFIGYGDYVSYGRNLVSPFDCGIMLEKIYKGEVVSKEYSEKMLDLLKRQQRRNKIPYPLPSGTATANKTGETSTVESDVGIVFSPSCDYIICVLSNNSYDGISGIRRISKMTYDYFN